MGIITANNLSIMAFMRGTLYIGYFLHDKSQLDGRTAQFAHGATCRINSLLTHKRTTL